MISPRSVGLVLLGVLLVALGQLTRAAETPPTASANPTVIKERRLALVIGNSAYEAAPLRNPVNDAKDFAAALADSGFEVTRLENASLRELRAALRDFGDRLKKQGGVGLFYFAGHGMQVKGRNYLIPVAAQIEREDEVEFESLDANLVLEKLDSAGNRFNIVILDACRNNPFARSFRSSTQGLAQMDAPSGAVVAFATSPGSVASDGGGRNGLYSQHLIETVRRPGLKIEEVFKQVRAAVRRDSNGKQTPWEATSLEGDFYFHPVDLVSVEAVRKQQEQERLETAVRVAIAQERERIRQEFELAQAKSAEARIATAVMPAPGPAAPTPASQTPSSGTASVAAAPAKTPVVAPAKTPFVDTAATSSAGVAVPTASDPPPMAEEIALASYPLELSPKLTPWNWSESSPPSSVQAVAPRQVIGSPAQRKILPPKFVVDDEWELLSITTDASGRGSEPPAIARLTATQVSEDTLTLSRVVLDRPGGDPLTGVTSHSVSSHLDSLFENANELSGQRKILSFPLETGTSWSYSYEYPMYSGTGKGRNELKSKVIGWEQVTVPAGTFWALKIEQTGWSNDLSPSAIVATYQRAGVRVDLTLWYSPEVKYIVKSIFKQGESVAWSAAPRLGFTSTMQLVRYTTAESRVANTTVLR
jgi:hypothetical protein